MLSALVFMAVAGQVDADPLAEHELPILPIADDAYTMWWMWPWQRIGVRSYMRSTYDRAGYNETADASHYLYQERDDFNVSLDVKGPGVLYFARYNHWHGSPWHYEVDGTDNIVRETSTADPDNPVEGSVFLPEVAFPPELTFTWSTTKGADLMWVPVPFTESFRMAYSRTHYGTGYYIYHTYVPGIPLSRPIVPWRMERGPDHEAIDAIKQAGTRLFPYADMNALTTSWSDEIGGGSAYFGQLLYRVRPNDRGYAFERQRIDEPHLVRAIIFTIPKADLEHWERARLKIWWDGQEEASVDAPLSLFYGAGTLYNRDDREYLVKGFPSWIRFDESTVTLACYWPMPFFKNVRFVLHHDDPDAIGDPATVRIMYEPFESPANHLGYFHATYRDHPAPEKGRDIVVLDTEGIEGAAEWSGSFVGMSWIFSHRAVLNTLEGDPRFFIDGCQTPSYGTGTEEWGGGGDYWGGRNMTLPLAGHPVGARNKDEAHNDRDLIQSAYRYLLADLMPFGRHARIQLEHGGENLSEEHYETVAFWYGMPAPSLVETDTIDVGDVEDEAAHEFDSPTASQPYAIASRYEWGPDTIRETGEVIYEAHVETGRTMTGTEEFTVALEPENHGVLLRRTIDYSYPNQRGEVYVADAGSDEFEYAGVWYEAGSNTCYFSYPKTETGKTNPKVQTSNRRFRDTEFLVPRDLTRGRDKVRVRIVFTPVNRPLLPGMEVPDLAWASFRYSVNCFKLPDFDPVPPKAVDGR